MEAAPRKARSPSEHPGLCRGAELGDVDTRPVPEVPDPEGGAIRVIRASRASRAIVLDCPEGRGIPAQRLSDHLDEAQSEVTPPIG